MFDPLDLISPPARRPLVPNLQSAVHSPTQLKISVNDQIDQSKTSNDNVTPIHVHDLPLLQFRPPSDVLLLILGLLAPETVLNFGTDHEVKDSEEVRDSEKKDLEEPKNEDPKNEDPENSNLQLQEIHSLFKLKNILPHLNQSMAWLQSYCPRFLTHQQLASLSTQLKTLKKSFSSEYNAWLTQIIASPLAWIPADKTDEIKTAASLRLSENCGRTAQPDFLRKIKIPSLQTEILLKEPSLTSDNLGLKTWGSSFILGSRLASHPSYLKGTVLELGSGTGLVGIVCGILGFSTVLTDLEEIVPNLLHNVSLNNVTGCLVQTLDWSDPSSYLAKPLPRKFSTIILSDPLYSAQHPVWIVNMINEFLDASLDSRVLLQVPVRRSFENERAHLWDLLTENGYVVDEEAIETGRDDFGPSDFIFRLYRRADLL